MKLRPPASWSAKRFHRRPVFEADGLKSRTLSPVLQSQLKTDGYKVASSSRGLKILIVGPEPLFPESSDWCWIGSFKQFLKQLVSEEIIVSNVKRRILRPQFNDWIESFPPTELIVKYKNNGASVKTIFPGIGKWHGKFAHFCHAIAVGYPNLHDMRSVLSRRRTWLFSDDLPNDEKLTDLVYSFGKGDEFNDRLASLKNPLSKLMDEELG